MTNHAYRPTYSLATSNELLHKDNNLGKRNGLRKRGTSTDVDTSDGNASLTYSAASSVNSGSTGAASNDSSFADIMRVLDTEDSDGLKQFIRKEDVSSTHDGRTRQPTSGQSVANSLAYSIDGESQLDGTQLLQTISGNSKSLENDLPLKEDMGLLFAPAEPGMIKKKKRNKNKPSPSLSQSKQSKITTPQSQREESSYHVPSPSPSEDTPTKAPPMESTPPPCPKKLYHVEDADQDDEIWYAKWWMFCFPDAARNLMPKR